MIVATTTTITLDPVEDAEVVQQYEKDEEYKKIIECTDIVVFKYEWPKFFVAAVYMPIQKEGEP